MKGYHFFSRAADSCEWPPSVHWSGRLLFNRSSRRNPVVLASLSFSQKNLFLPQARSSIEFGEFFALSRLLFDAAKFHLYLCVTLSAFSFLVHKAFWNRTSWRRFPFRVHHLKWIHFNLDSNKTTARCTTILTMTVCDWFLSILSFLDWSFCVQPVVWRVK